MFLYQLLRGLSFIHDTGVLHRVGFQHVGNRTCQAPLSQIRSSVELGHYGIAHVSYYALCLISDPYNLPTFTGSQAKEHPRQFKLQAEDMRLRFGSAIPGRGDTYRMDGLRGHPLVPRT